jgi:hypothetical protein
VNTSKETNSRNKGDNFIVHSTWINEERVSHTWFMYLGAIGQSNAPHDSSKEGRNDTQEAAIRTTKHISTYLLQI